MKNKINHKLHAVVLILIVTGLITCAAPSLTSSGKVAAQTTAPSWSYTGSLKTERIGFTATLLQNGKVLVVGGASQDQRAELYDPATGTWSYTGALNTNRSGHTATLLQNGKVLVVGGLTFNHSFVQTAELYDPTTGVWSYTGSSPLSGRQQHTATLLQNGKVLVAGGFPAADFVELFDPNTGQWSQTGSLVGNGFNHRASHTATLLQSGKVLVAGGYDAFDAPVLITEVYDPTTGTWSVSGNRPNQCYALPYYESNHTATLLPNGGVLIASACGAELYNPTTGALSVTGGMITPRSSHTATLMPDGRVLVAGGVSSVNIVGLDSAEIYNPTSGTWSTTANLNGPRVGHAAALLQNGKVLVVGGTPLPSAELYHSGLNSGTPRTNGKIAFTSDRDGNREIYVMNPDGTNQVRLTNNSVVDDSPTWSPDGTKIAFLCERSSGGLAICLMNGDGTNKTEITPVTSTNTISWSPQGDRITFDDGPDGDIFIVNIDGGNRVNVTSGPAQDLTPSWSPDGSGILFSRYIFPDANHVYGGTILHTIRPDGTGLRELPNGHAIDSFDDGEAKWSPAGDKIVFRVNFWDFWTSIDIADADGTNRRLFDGCTLSSCGNPNEGWLDRLNPSWSPDGNWIVFTVADRFYNALQIVVKNINGSGFKQLTGGSGNNFNPSWQPLASSACSNSNPIDCPDFFVRQQYRDFLNREAEPAGLQFYLDILNGCHPSDTECIRYTRGALSANFFRSPEFQTTGSYVMYLYMVTLGQRPITAAELQDASKVERPHYAEFIADMSAISSPDGRNGPDPAKKAALTEAFVQRAEVVAKYPTSTYPTLVSFGNALAATAGVTLSSTTQSAIAVATTRAQVLQIVAESAEVNEKFYKPAFVTMEYFGYLRRDPEDCHDPANYSGTGDPNACGYIFHNNRFNTLPLVPDMVQNFIVRGFIESPEYRRRFGP